MGVPGYQNSKITGTPDNTTLLDSVNHFFFYKWNGSKNNYTATSTSDYTFKPTEAYMLQYSGTISWSTSMTSSVQQAPVARSVRRANQECQFELHNADSTATDVMFVTFTDHAQTDDDELVNGYELSKIMNNTSLYSVAKDNDWAAIALPFEAERLTLGVSIAKADNYTFSLPKTGNAVRVRLYDRTEESYIDLSQSDYTVYLESGSDESRFELLFEAYDNSSVTALGEDAESLYYITSCNGAIDIRGIATATPLSLYDALGRLISHSTLTSDTQIAVPSGIYLLRLGTTTQKVVVR